jgi:hypothetical protein
VPEPDPAAPATTDAPAVPDGASDDLDALLAGLDAPTPPTPAEPEAAVGAADGTDELDALLAGLGAEPPPPAPDAAEADLDALLASLK